MREPDSERSTVSWVTHSLSVLVPAFNEQHNLEPTVDRLLRALNISVEDFEIIIVDDGSTDGTGRVADELAEKHLQVRVVRNPSNTGLGYSYLRGVALASKNFFVYIPADNTWPYRSFLELFGNMGKSDVVTSYSTNPEVRTPGRRIVSGLYTRILNILFGHRLHYYNGLTIYPLTFLKSNPITTYGFGFQAEALLKAIHYGFSIIEVALPIDERMAGKSKAVTIKNILSVASTVLRVFWDLRAAGWLSARLGTTRRHKVLSRTKVRSNSSAFEGIAKSPSGSIQSTARVHEGTERALLRIIVTGASAGIGAGLVEALAEDGHMLFVCARQAAILDQTTRQNTLARGRACDISDEGQVREFLGWVQALTQHIDVLVNCAGKFGAIGPVEVTDSEEWLDTMRVNLFGTYLMAKYALPLLARSSDPRIINFSGGGAFNTLPNYSAYACSKAAVVRLTECLAAELAPRGVAVNAIAPGFVATDLHQATLIAGAERAGKLAYNRTKAILESGGAQIADVVDCVRVLLSPEMHGLTGKTISVNFDPWRTRAFRDLIPGIIRSDLYTMRRINIVNLPDGFLKSALAEAWANYDSSS